MNNLARHVDDRRLLCCSGAAASAPNLMEGLAAAGLRVERVTSTREAVSRLETAGATLLDAESSAPDPRGVLARRRELGHTSPVLLLLDPAGRVDHRTAFEMGADDCVMRPVRVHELVARLERLLAGRAPSALAHRDPVLDFGPVRVDVARFEARRDGRCVALPARAFQLLRLLARRHGRAVSRDAIIDELWGPDIDVNQRTIDNLVLILRQLIEPEPSQPRVLRTVHRVGYRLVHGQP